MVAALVVLMLMVWHAAGRGLFLGLAAYRLFWLWLAPGRVVHV